MRHLISIICFACVITALVTNAQEDERQLPAPTITVETDQLMLDLFFEELPQGRVGLLRLTGEDVEEAVLSVFNRRVEFYPVNNSEQLFALLSVNLEQARRNYTATLNAIGADGTAIEPLAFNFEVTEGGFIRQQVTLIEDNRIEELLNEEIEANELNQIFSIASQSTEEALWDENGFVLPIVGELTSPFGAVRVFNDTYNSRHTGWDFNATLGAPMRSSGAGQVVFAGFLPIRGNYVLVDHGQGVLFGYAHLSVVYVTQGQELAAGQIIGQVGNTGRSSSAHAHVETIVDGNWVDTADFLQMALP